MNIIEKEWLELVEVVFDGTESRAQYIETRRAFYAGYASLFLLFVTRTSTYDLHELLYTIKYELDEYRNKINKEASECN